MANIYSHRSSRKTLPVILSLLTLLIHLYSNLFANYGYFRDELYYIACSNRLDIGYVDQPSFSILILYVSRLLFGDSLFALRLIPAVNSALTVFIVCMITKKLGGKSFAVFLSGISAALAPVYLAMNTFYSMNSFDILFWALSFYIVVLIISKSKTSYWILLGIVAGAALSNKIGYMWFCFGLLAGLLLTKQRKELMTFKPYIASAIALSIFMPFVIWNFLNDFAHVEFMRNAVSEKYSGIGIKDFLTGQLLIMNPISAFVWISGLCFLLFIKEGKQFNLIAIIYLTALVILITNVHSKPEYLAPAYTPLLSAGSIFIEKKTYVHHKWFRYAVSISILITGIILIPLAMPVLSEEKFIAYSGILGMKPSSSEKKVVAELPQFYADMHGWEEMAKNVSEVYMSLPKEERFKTIVFAQNYGEAAAMEFFGRIYPVPKTISSHNSYWLWGYGDIENPNVIIIGGEKENHLKLFEVVEEKKIHTAEFTMPYENNIKLYLAQKFKAPVSGIWNKIKHYD